MGARLFSALTRGMVSQLQPAMLALLLVPFLVAVLGWGLVAWWVWDPLNAWLSASLFGGSGLMSWLSQWSGSLGGVLTTLVALLLVVPMMFASAVVLIAVFATPMVIRHLSQGLYRDLARQGSWSVGASLWNALSSLVLFLVGYLASLPLWLIPPLALVVPWLWWSWLTARMMRFDSLVEHASPQERNELIRRYRGEYLLLGLAVTALNYIPPLFLITPVLSALVFGHFSLSRLAELRSRPLPAPIGAGR